MGSSGWSLQEKRAWDGAPLGILPDVPLLPLPLVARTATLGLLAHVLL